VAVRRRNRDPVRDMFRIRQAFDVFTKEVDQETIDVVQEAASLVLQKSREFVPVDTGALRFSGKVSVTTIDTGRGLRVTGHVTYGGQSRTTEKDPGTPVFVDYAAAVHELNTPYLLRGIQAAKGEISQLVKKRYKILARKGKKAAPKTRFKDIEKF